MKEKIFPYGKHYIDQDDINAVTHVLKYKNLTQGEEVTKFEEEIAKYVGSNYAVAVSSWTSGLHISCLTLGVSKGDFVVTSPITFVASSNSVLYCQGTPIFCDIDNETINMCPNKLEDILKKFKVKAVMPVHFSGVSCKMDDIKFLSKKYNFKIIEDAAHALGANHSDGTKVGSCKFSDIAGFSLHPVKSIAAGEGGMITTNNENYYKKLIRLRSHGINKNDDRYLNPNFAFTKGILNPWYYEMQELGYNYRLTDIQSALGRSQLKKLQNFIEKRKNLALVYDKELETVSNVNPIQSNHRLTSSHHLYVVRINFDKTSISRAELMLKLRDKGILTQVHYIPILRNPYYNKHIQKNDSFLNTKNYFNECLSLPLYYELKEDNVKYIVKELDEILKN
jgi:UDP-4-amino-4,6-dideoxy-N-acetyl-beta-L-altrosamine transaminase